ncbi:CLUMA_CG000463, isoform A [Clunio marinus]|uniref:CLUMA_CG000463, isoform A n=1 Tax=Clunio marinus TaxID=568069 RepID=A0A1J1HFK1_9DIPT|nr:CLUMA_CG000463, isoform A [Clunio marinus]
MPNIRKLSESLQQLAYDELNEKPERIQADIDALRSWLSQTTYLKSRDDDQFLVTFLRGCKYSLEKAKKKIEMFYVARTSTPEFFTNRDPTDKYLQEIINLGLIMPLPVDESKTDARIILTRLGGYDYNKYNFLSVMKVTYLMADWCLINSDVTIISGHINVVDLKGCGIGIMSQITPTLIKKLSSLLEPFPVRVKAIHLVHPPKGIETAFKILMSVCHEKLRSRIFMHENFDELHKVVDKKYLPKEYGGSNSSLPEIIVDWRQKILESRQWYLEDPNYRIESLNGTGATDYGTMFGAEGSFRSLNID